MIEGVRERREVRVERRDIESGKGRGRGWRGGRGGRGRGSEHPRDKGGEGREGKEARGGRAEPFSHPNSGSQRGTHSPF
jgi:hypothetical protein